ncbi:MAG: hypothetical protein M1831_004161 [Alyxoria varia]|nr:MAG: hypothetical protein M1831_004161 [Alyxoria varia]
MSRQHISPISGARIAFCFLFSAMNVLASPTNGHLSSLSKRQSGGVTADSGAGLVTSLVPDLPLPKYDTSTTNFQCQSDPIVAPPKEDFQKVVEALEGQTGTFPTGKTLAGCNTVMLPPTGLARVNLCFPSTAHSAEQKASNDYAYKYEDILKAIKPLADPSKCGDNPDVGGISPVTGADFNTEKGAGNYVLVDRNDAPS